MWHFQQGPQKTELGEVEEGLLQSEKQDKDFVVNVDRRRPGWVRLYWTWILQSAMLACSLTLWILSWYHEPSEAACTQKLFSYCKLSSPAELRKRQSDIRTLFFSLIKLSRLTAPALEAVTYHDETLLGGFLRPSPYRGTPTLEIDSRWEELWDWGAFSVPEDKIHLLNKSRSEPWHHTDPEFGGGVAGLFWGFHQIHCLDLLRQMSYKDEYEQSGQGLPSILRDAGEKRRAHLDHCIELLRIDMMCQADVTPYLVKNAAPGNPPDALRVDFSVFKKCRDFGKIKDWMKDHIAIKSVRDSQSHWQE